MAPGVAVTLWRNGAADEATVRCFDGRETTASVLGTDRSADLAVLRVDDDASGRSRGPSARCASATRWSRSPTRPGAGCARRPGASSCAPRAVRGPGGRLIEGAIEHTAPLPRGSGGGPLVDADGAISG